jgi:hypothetical protein
MPASLSARVELLAGVDEEPGDDHLAFVLGVLVAVGEPVIWRPVGMAADGQPSAERAFADAEAAGDVDQWDAFASEVVHQVFESGGQLERRRTGAHDAEPNRRALTLL